MNKEDFITYEQAVKLKELGFDEPCSYYYNPNQQLSDVKKCALSPEVTNNRYLNEISDRIATTPTLAQAAKWLREKHNLYVDVYLDHPTVNDSIWAYSLTEINRNKLGCNESIGYNTYEEALSAGIDKVLEII